MVTDLFQEFLDFSFPNLINTDNFKETLASTAPDQTILMKSTYDHSQLQTSNSYSFLFASYKTVIDFKNCFAYTHAKPAEQRLANFSEGHDFCYNLLGKQLVYQQVSCSTQTAMFLRFWNS